MTRVLYFSAAGHSRALAEYFAAQLGTKAEDVQNLPPDRNIEADTAVLVFPVYCQTIPRPMRGVIARIEAKHFVLIAAYGRMHHGNALYEAAALCNSDIIGAAYIPTGHTYLREGANFEVSALAPLIACIAEPKKVTLTTEPVQSWAALFPALRSRLGVRISRSDGCTKCGMCSKGCPTGAMNCGDIGKGCIRCLRCVHVCPEKALEFRLSLPMRLYLNKRKRNDTILYIK